MVPGFEMRVGDAERDAAATELREHFASGRLTQDELNERLDRAFAARTRGDLHAVMTDLPSAQPGWAAGPAAPGTPFAAAGSRWTGPGASYGRDGAGSGRSCGAGYGWPGGGRRRAGAFIVSSVALWALLILGFAGAFGFGFGGGRPFTIMLIIAAFSLLRRLVFGVFGRRRGGMRGPRRRR